MENEMLPVLRKPTATVQLSHSFTHGERKLLNTLMFYAQHQGKGYIANTRHDISLKDVYAAIGWTESNNIDALKNHMKVLMSTVIEWNQYEEDRTKPWEICTFITYGAIEKGRLRYTINERIAEDMVRPTLFAKVQLLVQGRFTRKHALILYEYFQDMIGRGKPTNEVSIDFILKHLGLKTDTYGQYKYLQRDVLKPAIAEINKYSDLTVSHKAIRSGRSTTGVSFSVERSESFQLSFDMPSSDAAGESDSTDIDVAQLLEQQGVTAKVAKSSVAQFGIDRCRAALMNLEATLKSGKPVNNTGAWLRTAIREGWKPPTSVTPQTKHAAALARAKAEEQDSAVREAYQAHRSALAKREFASRSKSYQTRRKNAYIKQMEAERNEIVLRQYKERGWEGHIVWACFMTESFIEELIGELPEASLSYFLEHHVTRQPDEQRAVA